MSAAIGREFAFDIALYRGLINADIIFPVADNSKVGAGDSGYAVIGAAGHLEFKFVGKSRAVELILIFIGQEMAESLGIIA